MPKCYVCGMKAGYACQRCPEGSKNRVYICCEKCRSDPKFVRHWRSHEIKTTKAQVTETPSNIGVRIIPPSQPIPLPTVDLPLPGVLMNMSRLTEILRQTRFELISSKNVYYRLGRTPAIAFVENQNYFVVETSDMWLRYNFDVPYKVDNYNDPENPLFFDNFNELEEHFRDVVTAGLR